MIDFNNDPSGRSNKQGWSVLNAKAKTGNVFEPAALLWREWSSKSCQPRPSFLILLACAIAMILASEAFGKESVPVQLKAKDGSTHISGRLLKISNEQYHVDTKLFGILKLKISDFECDGSICPEPLESAILIAKAEAKAEAKAKVRLVTVSAKNDPSTEQPAFVLPTGSRTQKLLALIAVAEATHRGYDTVQLRARIKPPAPPTQLTMGQIKQWVRNTPRQQHAIGRYQFIPKTFNSLQKRLGLNDETLFSPAVQDEMALVLLKDAGYGDFLAGKMGSNRFMDKLAAIWAGLPMQSGRSKYHGYAGNKASISRAYFAKNVSLIFDQSKPEGGRG